VNLLRFLLTLFQPDRDKRIELAMVILAPVIETGVKITLEKHNSQIVKVLVESNDPA
jgi:hypothetical protein